ncbi:hypothetical protein Bca52824_057962 [Brassica carinata]|uniref:Uncharacterized protein n=1 Tax=Brassica carinata TaxID=52824 RepID=A0A8X7QS80_BRACI|nr:hypothetical protein Bca52824_057962 [Brassica carinata]
MSFPRRPPSLESPAAYYLSGDLKAGRCRKTVVTRVLRFWEARNVKKGGSHTQNSYAEEAHERSLPR